MSLRLRLFLLFGGLLALLVVGQWWMARAFTADLAHGLDRMAFSVGCEMMTGMACASESDGGPPDPLMRRFVLKGGREGAATDFSWVGSGPIVPIPGGMGRATKVPEGETRVLVTAEGGTVEKGAPPAPGAGGAIGHPGPKLIEERREVRVVEIGTATTPPDPAALRKIAEAATGTAGAPMELEMALDRTGGMRVLRLEGPNIRRSIEIREEGVDRALDRFFRRFFAGSAAILVVGLLAVAFVSHRVSEPLGGLAKAAKRIGSGELGAQAPESGGGEVREAIGEFNRMSTRLAELDEQAKALRARQHLSEIGEMARGLAHSLRNPLNAVGLALEELAAMAPSGDERAAALADSARRQIRRADGSIRSFLALASAGGGAVSEPVDLSGLARDVALEAIQDGRGRVRIDVEPAEGSCAIRGVAPELRAVLQALVVNAVEASPDGGRVVVRLLPADGGAARVEVDDEGPGVAAEVRARLFEPHVTTKPNGSGMGLFLARRIAESRYGGRLALDDRAPRGTRATLELGERSDGDA